MSCEAEKSLNLEKAALQIRHLARQGAQIICLQELFATPYFCFEENPAYFDLAEPIPGPSTEYFQALARETQTVLIVSLFEHRAPGLYHNTTAVLNADGQYLGKYRKTHIPDDPGFYEKYYFTPGDLGYRIFETAYAKIGVLICWDQWYPEAARLTALHGAEILFYPTAIGWEPDETEAVNQEQYQAWQLIQRSHAVANGIPVVAVNRVGLEAGTLFWGGSFVSNAFGSVVYQASHTQEVSYVFPLDLAQSEQYRRIWPFLRDRRIDTYAPLTQRYLGD
ncbi:MAG: carbon-nitrogen hydrolase [Microscillaceae bacterium]|nr:carbon-nitrogen hydrolase [Microscillaceae bacterium]